MEKLEEEKVAGVTTRKRQRSDASASLEKAQQFQRDDDGDPTPNTVPKKKKRKSTGTKTKKQRRGIPHLVGEPDDVVKRYEDVLATYQKEKNMAKSFKECGVNKGTMMKTAAIAELAIAAPTEYDQVKKGRALGKVNNRCKEVIKKDRVISDEIAKMKDEGKLLPITKKV